jgi:hypothetical protein
MRRWFSVVSSSLDFELGAPVRHRIGEAGMNRTYCICIASVGLALAMAGCRRPRLVSRPLTEMEASWAHMIDGNYPSWKPPFFTPAQGASPLVAPPASMVPAPRAIPVAPVAPARTPPSPLPARTQWHAPLPSAGPAGDDGVEFVPVD